MAEGATKEKKKKSKLVLILILLVLLGGLGGGGWFAWTKYLKPMLAGGGNETAKAEAPAEGHGKEAAGHEKKGASGGAGVGGEMVSLPTFVVNLADPMGRRYLKLTLDVEVGSKEAAAEVSAAEAKIRDSVILLLSSKTYQDLAPMEAKIQLKNEIVERLNQTLGGHKVQRVYITEMVVQ